ncbi:sensor domain-containing diguanylate cyclase [Pseudidiomarina sediminum]|uniref:GGDEF domain-containing protein n=1 Tax=Pseudidiomarina sediminum TaxID=431675 RepID=UPI001C9725DF|nr:diguanylate cyclase [Pseudidiomarina sediminum]MBY6064809.1 diguanylate cyclase [Pseudidiomarina sediminum]
MERYARNSGRLLAKGVILFALVLTALVGTITTSVIREFEQEKQRDIDAGLTSLGAKITSRVDTYRIFSHFVYVETIHTEPVVALLRQAKDADATAQQALREQLYLKLQPTFERLQQHDFRQLHFHLPNGESFLRFHRPDKFGDYLFDVRETVRRANLEQRFIEGFEEGRIFNGYRFVYPVMDDGELLATVEVSISMATLVRSLLEIYHDADLYFMIRKDVVQEKLFDDELSNYSQSFIATGYLFDNEVYGDAMPLIKYPYLLHQHAHVLDAIAPQLASGSNFGHFATLEGKTYRFLFFAITNHLDEQVAYLVSVEQSNNLDVISNAYTGVIGLIVLVTLLVFLILAVQERNRRRLKLLAATDTLTKLSNRNRFIHVFSRASQRCQRSDESLVVAMIDIDHFKRVNDTYGHNVGDEVLRELSLLIRRHLKGTDTVARWGGEEFVCLLPETNEPQGLRVADKIRRQVAAHKFEVVGRITISIGVAQYQRDDHNIDAVIERADKALYRAKQTGRNKVLGWHEL